MARTLRRLTATPRNELVQRWLLALGCYALLIFFFSPSWAAFQLWSRVPELGGMIETRRGASVLWQVEHLGAPVPDRLHAAIQWRLLFPVIGRVLHLPPFALFALAHVGCVATLWFVLSLLRQRGIGVGAAVVATLILGSAAWFFASVCWVGYFDSWVVFGLLVIAFARSPWALISACTLGPWVDERFVIGAVLALFCRYLDQQTVEGQRRDVRRELWIPLGVLAAFVGIRLGVLSSRTADEASVGTYMGNLRVLGSPLSRFLFGIWEGLRVAWLGVIAAVLLLWKRRQSDGLLLGFAVLVVVVLGVTTAQDFSRAMMLVAPVVVLGFATARAFFDRGSRWMPFAAGAALLLPAHHVMSDRVAPIYYLYHELAAFDSPPPAAMAELHELRGIRAMQEGDLVQAAEALSLAIKLARNPAGPSKQRGVLFAGQQHWAEAKADFATMVTHEPANPEGWFLRAQAEMALGETTAGVADVQHALEIGPPEFVKRPDVMRFVERLKQQGALR